MSDHPIHRLPSKLQLLVELVVSGEATDEQENFVLSKIETDPAFADVFQEVVRTTALMDLAAEKVNLHSPSSIDHSSEIVSACPPGCEIDDDVNRKSKEWEEEFDHYIKQSPKNRDASDG